MSNQRRNFPVRGPRRQTSWVGSADQSYVAVGAGASVLTQSVQLTGVADVSTVVRTRGQISITPQVFTADAEITGAWGMGIVSQQAFAAGAVSIPRPFTDNGWDGWFAWVPFSFRYGFNDASGTLIESVELPIDSKGMRKVKSDDVIVVMAESQAIAFRISGQFRMLVKLA